MSDIGCQVCQTYDIHEPCARCGNPIHIGSTVQCPHEKAGPTKGFESYYDWGLGKQIDGAGDRNRELRPKWHKDHMVHIQPRDLPSTHYKEVAERRAERAARAKEQK